MKCKKCRKAIPDNSKFCNHCGAPQEKKKLYRRPDGLYEKVMTIDGKRVAFRAKKEADVYKKIREYEVKKKAGPLFEEVAEQWYDEKTRTVSPTTEQSYKPIYEELKEYFKGVYISKLTHKDISAYIKGLPKSYARKTCTNRLSVLNSICKLAIAEDYLTDNPCSCISVPKTHSSKKRRAPTSHEIEQIKKSIGVMYKNFPVGLYVVFSLYTGLRRGEVLALTYGDIDRKEKIVKVSKSVYFVSNEGRLKEPKTEAGIREVPIPDSLLKMLPNGKKSDYVFSTFSDRPMTESFQRDAMDHWQKETGLKLTAHQLRHGYATLLHEADIDVKDAQELLGHADAGTTQNIYTEVSAKRKKAVAERINSYLQ